MSKMIKEFEINAIRQTFDGMRSFIVLEPLKVDSSTDFQFRKALREKNMRAQLVRNNFARKVLSEAGIELDCWSGPSLFCWGGGSVKELSNHVDELIKKLKKDPKAPENYKVKQAVADGEKITMELAKTLPTREEAIGDVLSALLGPGSELVAALTGPGASIASILKTIEEKEP